MSRVWDCGLTDRDSILGHHEKLMELLSMVDSKHHREVSGQEDSEIHLIKWTLFGPEERLLAQGKARIHTSCRSE